MPGRLRAETSRCGWASAITISTDWPASPSPSSSCATRFVLYSSSVSPSTTATAPSFARSESALRSAARRIFLVSRCSWLRGTGPNTTPPPDHCGERIEPCRARPVPFWRHGLMPPPDTVWRFLVLWVPARRFASCRRTSACSRSVFTRVSKTAAGSSTEPALRLSTVTTSSVAMECLDSSELDLDVDAGRELELHQRVHRLRRRIEDVDQALVRADLELLARLLVDVGAPQHGVLVDRGRQRDRPRDARAGPHGGVDDLPSALVEQLEVVRLHADADLLGGEVCHFSSLALLALRARQRPSFTFGSLRGRFAPLLFDDLGDDA